MDRVDSFEACGTASPSLAITHLLSQHREGRGEVPEDCRESRRCVQAGPARDPPGRWHVPSTGCKQPVAPWRGLLAPPLREACVPSRHRAHEPMPPSTTSTTRRGHQHSARRCQHPAFSRILPAEGLCQKQVSPCRGYPGMMLQRAVTFSLSALASHALLPWNCRYDSPLEREGVVGRRNVAVRLEAKRAELRRTAILRERILEGGGAEPRERGQPAPDVRQSSVVIWGIRPTIGPRSERESTARHNATVPRYRRDLSNAPP